MPSLPFVFSHAFANASRVFFGSASVRPMVMTRTCSSCRPSTSASMVVANRFMRPMTSSCGRFQFSDEKE